ncbi:MAG TPA: hypothetical protein VG457_14780 [Planctomycetota bacterium]|nr:hypothetical protein [Planctomycetota bacterium]
MAALRRIPTCIDGKGCCRDLPYLDELIRRGESTDRVANLSLVAAVKVHKDLWEGIGAHPDKVRLKAKRHQAFEDLRAIGIAPQECLPSPGAPPPLS